MTRGRFLEQVREAIKFCDDEGNAGFDLISGLGGSDVDLIEEVDIDALVDLFEGLAGTGTSSVIDISINTILNCIEQNGLITLYLIYLFRCANDKSK